MNHCIVAGRSIHVAPTKVAAVAAAVAFTSSSSAASHGIALHHIVFLGKRFAVNCGMHVSR